MAIASVIAASIRNNSHRRYSPNASKPDKKMVSLVNEASLSTQWLRQSPTGRLNHINKPLLKEIDSQIKQISKKELHESKLNKSYQALIQYESNYQVAAEAIYSARENLKSNALFCALVLFGLLLIICIPTILVLYPLALLLTLAHTLILISSFSAANSNSGLHSKHPNEIDLNLHFKSFMHALERYKNRPNNSEANFQQSSKNTPPHSKNPERSINTSSLNCNASLFKLANPQEEQPIAKKEVSYTHLHVLSF